MAISFDRASSEYLEIDSAPVSSYPLTLACWFNSSNTTDLQYVMWLGDKDVANQFLASLILEGGAAGDPVRHFAWAGGGDIVSVDTTTGYSANTWHHACAVAAAVDDRAVYIDGGSKGTDVVTSRNPTGADRYAIGGARDSTPGFYVDGAIAEAAIWNAALTDAEVASLAKGFSPLFIRPQNLVRYDKLIRDYNDVLGGAALSAGGTPTVSGHSAVLYPAPPMLGFTASPVGGVMAAIYYRNLLSGDRL